jgi:uncharacterized membrane protein
MRMFKHSSFRVLPARLLSGTRGFRRDERGSVAIMAGLFFVMIAGLAALAIDIGSLYLERRVLQGVSDLAAIAGAGDIEQAEQRVEATLAANGVEADYEVVRGFYLADPKVAPESRFSPGRTPYNAVQVALSQPGNIFFARAFSVQEPEISVMAVAARAELAAFGIGSRLASLQGGVANQVLGALTGGSVSLSVMDYRALADADITVADALSGLATSGKVTAGTYGEVLDASVTLGDFLEVVADVAGANGDAAASLALRKLARAAGSGLDVPLSTMVDAGPFASLAVGDKAPGFDISASALELVSAATTLANGERQVEIDLDLGVPGIARARLALAIGEPMQGTTLMAVGGPGTRISTAQMRLRLLAEVGGEGLLKTIRLRLPVYLDLAHASAGLERVACQSSGAVSVRVGAKPGLANLWIGEIDLDTMADFSAPAPVDKTRIVELPLIKVDGIAHVESGSARERSVSFSRSDIGRAPGKSLSSDALLQTAVSSLLGDLSLEIRMLGMGLGELAVSDAVTDTLAKVALPLDSALNTLLGVLGVNVGEADLRLFGVRCDGGVLAG